MLSMNNWKMSDSALILRIPFLRTANKMISMKEGIITMEVGDEKI